MRLTEDHHKIATELYLHVAARMWLLMETIPRDTTIVYSGTTQYGDFILAPHGGDYRHSISFDKHRYRFGAEPDNIESLANRGHSTRWGWHCEGSYQSASHLDENSMFETIMFVLKITDVALDYITRVSSLHTSTHTINDYVYMMI